VQGYILYNPDPLNDKKWQEFSYLYRKYVSVDRIFLDSSLGEYHEE